jgi:hypothetical protein
MPPPPREKINWFGQILTEFVNANNPDDAVRSYFENLCKFHNFPEGFRTEIQKRFPFLDDFENALSFVDKRLMILASEEERIKMLLNNLLGAEGMGLDYYIPENNTLMLVSFEDEYVGSYNGEPDFVTHVNGPNPYKSVEVAELIDNSNCDFYKRDCNYQKEIEKLMQFGIEINRIKQNASDHVKKNPLIVSERYEEIKNLNESIQNLQSGISGILLAITEGKTLKEITNLQYVLKRYNSIPQFKIIISDENCMVVDPNLVQERYLFEGHVNKWSTILKQDFAYVLIEYLKIENSAKYIRKCDQCERFFIAGKIDPRIKYCEICSRRSKMSKAERKDYQKQYRRRKREEREEREKEKKIENYMEKLDCTREEAEKIIEADSKL